MVSNFIPGPIFHPWVHPSATGAVLEAVDRVLHGEAHNAFCAVRPPGHHAGVELHCMGAVSNGFCILNNVALAALYAHHYG